MTRCQSCDGILTKKDEVCYYCGEEAPGHEKGGLSLPMVLAVGLILIGRSHRVFVFLGRHPVLIRLADPARLTPRQCQLRNTDFSTG